MGWRSILAVYLAALSTMTCASRAQDVRGAAITDPQVLEKLDRSRGLGLKAVVERNGITIANPDAEVSNEDLFKTAEFASIKASLEKEYRAYTRERPKLNIGEGVAYNYRLFQRHMIYSDHARFVLAGVVNRMDRTYKAPETCGEIRLIYRLVYTTPTFAKNGTPTTSRLPMTLNVILDAVPAPATADQCADLASRWLSTARTQQNTATLADRLVGQGGALEISRLGRISRIEINMQLARAPAAVVKNFGGHADYLLKVFAATPTGFQETTLENQLDRAKLAADVGLRDRLLRWLTTPETLRKLDDGTIVVPKEYLATSAISVTPGGPARSANQQAFGYIMTGSGTAPGALTYAQISDALKRAEAAGNKFSNIQSPMGFEHRLNDISCSGCHQTRGIGGFHFLGIDWGFNQPSNSIFVPGSPHFMGDQARRVSILNALRAKAEPDYSRGFSARPQIRGRDNLNGSGYYNGWGATCYDRSARTDAEPIDPSFEAWNCADGLTCRVLMETTFSKRLGVCATFKRIGDPTEQGQVSWDSFGSDQYTSLPIGGTYPPPPPNPATQVASHQKYDPSDSSGGFFGGALRTKSCNNLATYPEAACSSIAADHFNDCLVKDNRPFSDCVREFTKKAGLRKCNQQKPCRDDYICVATDEWRNNIGACIPPYFVFQFRVDGHPSLSTQPSTGQ